MKKDIIVISFGGSLIVQNQIDTVFLKEFRNLILKYIRKGKRFVIICGGGRTARNYQEAARSVAELEKCGAGAGELACRYVGFGSNGAICNRFNELRNAILFKNTTAQGSPKGLYPKCQEEIQATIQKANEQQTDNTE